MKAQIKHIHSPDVDDLENYQSHENYNILVQIILSPADEEGEESFDVEVCSTKHLEETYKNEPVNLRHTILMNKFSYNTFKNFVEKTFCTASAETWNELALILSRYGRWEFEDYKEKEEE